MRISLANEMLQRINVVVDTIGRPACFESSKKYKLWLEAEKLCHTQPIRKFICEDCTPKFKTDMMLEKRCNNIAYNNGASYA